jgi:hypothetical protein
MPVRITLDTSALRSASLDSGPFEALARLAEAGYVEILLPDVAVREFNSLPSKKREAKEALNKAMHAAKKALPKSDHNVLEEIENQVAVTFDKFEKAAKASLKKWMMRTKAHLLPVGAHHGKAVVAKYFDGTPPFRSKKSRDDFPDGFIVESILDAAKQGEVLVVAGDGGITKALQSVEGIVVYESVRELLESDEFDDLKAEVENDNVLSLLTVAEKSLSALTNQFSDALVNEVAGKTVAHYDAFNDMTNEYYVDTAGVVEWKIDFAKHEYLGEGVITMPFEGVLEVSVDTSTGDYFEDATYGTNEDSLVRVRGWMSIIVEDPSMLDKPVDWTTKRLLDSVTVQIDELSTTLIDVERGRTKFEAEEAED